MPINCRKSYAAVISPWSNIVPPTLPSKVSQCELTTSVLSGARQTRLPGITPQFTSKLILDSEEREECHEKMPRCVHDHCYRRIILRAGICACTNCHRHSTTRATQKTIGGVTKPEVVPSLIVFNSRGVSLQGNKLVLTGVSPNSIVFADRPVRAAGHDLTSNIIDDWATGSDNFAKDPPNATVSAFSKDGATIRDAVVVLKTPKLEGDRLTFDVDVLEGNLTGADGPAAVFIDIIGRPLTPFSFAGVARRTAYRGAYYRGAPPPVVPLQPTVRLLPTAPYGFAALCGYYPYPPCY